MGLHTILENENQYQAGITRKSVQSSGCQRPKSEKADEKEKLSSRNFLLNNLNGDLMEMYSENSSSPYRRSMPSRPFGMDVQGDEMIKRRGSVYQSSSEVRKMKRMQEYRRKVEQAQGDDAFLSFEISNSYSLHCQSKSRLLARKKKSLSTSSTKDQNSAATDSTIMTSSDDFLDLSFRPLQEHKPAASHSLRGSVVEKGETSEDFLEITLFPDGLGKCRLNTVSEPAGTDSFEVSTPRCDTNLCLENDCNVPSQGDKRQPLAKSFSAKVGMLRSLDHSDDVFKVSPGSRFGPTRKTLDCMAKSKSQRSPMLSREEKGGNANADSRGTASNARPKSFFNDVSGTPNKTEKMIQEVVDMQVEEMASSPVHLSATLKLDKRCGKSSFEFVTKDPEDCLSAKAWRTNNALNWVYTFHRSKTRNSSWTMKDRCKQPPQLIGQMQASCYLCSEISKNQSLENSTVMEFVLYDIAQARSTAGDERSNGLAEDPQTPKDALVDNSIRGSSIEGDGTIDSKKPKLSSQASTGDVNPDVPDSRPLAPADLLPSLEIAAIAMQVPCEMKESFRNRKVGDDNVNERQDGESIANQDTRTAAHLPNLKVIIPSGRHGLACTEGRPSPLLDRWKSGGVCDCGGWDMGCPIAIFDNNQCDNTVSCFPKKGCQPLQLFSQGKKDTIPSLTMSPHEDGQYSVHFHAKFSSLQAFSICVAILHGLRSFAINGEDTNVPMLHSKSLKLLLEEEVRHLLGAVAEEKMKAKQMNADSLPMRYVLDPPFSPIGRV